MTFLKTILVTKSHSEQDEILHHSGGASLMLAARFFSSSTGMLCLKISKS
jgi:hypothetical protein